MAIESEINELTLNDLLRHSLDGLFVIDRNRRYVMFSAGCERITGLDSVSVIGTQCRCHDVTDCQDAQGRTLSGALCPSLKIFEGHLDTARQRMTIKHRDGRTVWVETSYSPMLDENGAVSCVVGILRDITDAKLRENEMCSANAEWDSGLEGGDGFDGGAREGSDTGDRPLDEVLTTIERREILAALRRANGQRTLAAQLLKISRSRLYRRMEALGIDPRTLGSGGGA